MEQITRVMVANDRLDGMESALAKAALIEHYTGAEVRAVTVVHDSVADEPAEVMPDEQRIQLIEALKAAERQGLRRIADRYRGKVADLDIQVLWNRDARAAILDAAARAGVELLIKPVSEHHPLGDYLHTPLDWALMRDASCSVLISRRADWNAPSCVLAAVDVTDVKHLALTRAVLTSAATLARVTGVPLHVATAYPSLGQSVGDLQVAMDYAGIKADMRAARQKATAHWITSLELEVGETHLLEGKPAVVIPDLANRLDATVTVLGTAARTGLRKLLIGNTAEDIIGRLRGDLLVVREPWS